MNAKFLERFVSYRATHDVEIAKLLLAQKIHYQFSILRPSTASSRFVDEIHSAATIAEIVLVEARAARAYWTKFHGALQGRAPWFGRVAHQRDAVNQLLDIGYHYLAQKIVSICDIINMPTELGIFHKAQSAHAHPLAYDFMEPFRTLVVDAVLLKMLHKKKKPIGKTDVDKKFIASFVYHIKKKTETFYFHRHLSYCITLEYWIQLLLLEFMGAVRKNAPYSPSFPAVRHESRCKKKPLSKKKAVAAKAIPIFEKVVPRRRSY